MQCAKRVFGSEIRVCRQMRAALSSLPVLPDRYPEKLQNVSSDARDVYMVRASLNQSWIKHMIRCVSDAATAFFADNHNAQCKEWRLIDALARPLPMRNALDRSMAAMLGGPHLHNPRWALDAVVRRYNPTRIFDASCNIKNCINSDMIIIDEHRTAARALQDFYGAEKCLTDDGVIILLRNKSSARKIFECSARTIWRVVVELRSLRPDWTMFTIPYHGGITVFTMTEVEAELIRLSEGNSFTLDWHTFDENRNLILNINIGELSAPYGGSIPSAKWTSCVRNVDMGERRVLSKHKMGYMFSKKLVQTFLARSDMVW